jgi:Flp pilus assembly protein TadD
MKPWGYHLVSLVLHALDTVILFVLTMALLVRWRPDNARECPRSLVVGAGLAVAFFAVHPLRTEVVAWVSCQTYLPCALFYMLAILAYLRAADEPSGSRPGWLATSWLLFALALLSKAPAVSLPFVLLILDVFPLRRLGNGPGRWFGRSVHRVWAEKAAFLALSLVFMGLAIKGRAYEPDPWHIQKWSLGERIAQSCYVVWFYLVKTVLPSGITAYYALPERLGLRALPFLLSFLGTLAVSVCLFLLRRRCAGLLAAWLGYLVTMAPHLGLIRSGNYIAADRYCYIAMGGVAVAMAAGLWRLLQAAERARPAAAWFTVAGLAVPLVGLLILSRAQCRTWHTPEVLWTHVVTHGGSGSSLAQYNLGMALYRQGRLEEARARLATALRLDPNYAEAHNNLGAVMARQGLVDEACAHYREALRLNPKQIEAHNNLGVALFKQGLVDEACTHYREALRLNPKHIEAHNNLGVALLELGRGAEAVAHYTEALRADPGRTDVHKNLGLALSKQGRLDEAMVQYAEAARLDPTDAEAHTNLGAILLYRGRLDEAMAQYAETVRLDPGKVEALNNRAAIWASAPDAKLRDGHRAVEAATRAGELTGWKDPDVLDTCAAAHAEAGDFENAVKWETRAIDLLNDEKRKEDFRGRLRLYQARRPYRMVIEGR